MLLAVDSEERDRQHWSEAEEGAELIAAGEHAAALEQLSAVCQTDPENAYAFFFLGTALFEQEEFARALKAFLTAIQLKPDYLGALAGAGFSLRSMGRHAEALRVARQMLHRVKDDPDGLYLAGLSHHALGDRAASLGYLTRFLETGPEIEVALEVEGLLKLLRGEVESEEPDRDG